ncbi:MFS transporter [Pontiellaceae bacterium B12227]|nr:MFS transporter [Pontiellaceae bacterium B12227]
MLSDQQRKKVFNIIILTQCLGMLSAAFYQNGFFLNYFTKLGISNASIAFLFALPPLVGGALMIPSAFLADRTGKIRQGLIGQGMVVIGLFMVLAVGWVEPHLALVLLAVGILIFSIGGTMQGASWFALLNPIVPREIRGRFFGRLRVTFMTVCIIFSLLITRLLGISESMTIFQVIIGIVCLAHVVRFFTYARIPELEQEHKDTKARTSLKESLKFVFGIPGFGAFNSYVLLITLFTAAIPLVYGLMQKDVFDFTPARIQLMGTLFLAGSVAGNLVGGRLVDRWGVRLVFLGTHICYTLVILAMLARFWIPLPLAVQVGAGMFMFSLIAATSGIAVTSEMLELIPARNKSLSTAVSQTLFSMGIAASQLFVSRSISWELLAPEWTMLGRTFTAYDSLLLAFACMTLVLLATIGLVPKVVKKAQLLPGTGYPRF